jgi:hypothetical protein
MQMESSSLKALSYSLEPQWNICAALLTERRQRFMQSNNQPSNPREEQIADAGFGAMSYARALRDADLQSGPLVFKAGSDSTQKQIRFARDALELAEEVERSNPGAAFIDERGELPLSAAICYLRQTIQRAEELYAK